MVPGIILSFEFNVKREKVITRKYSYRLPHSGLEIDNEVGHSAVCVSFHWTMTISFHRNVFLIFYHDS